MKRCTNIKNVIALTLSVSCATLAIAGEVAIPNTFVSGEAAVAADVNDNFSAVKSAVDDNDSRISALETETGFISVSPQAFRNEDAASDCRWNTIANVRYGYYESGGDNGCDAVAAIQLPHGATVTSLTCYLYDNSLIVGSSLFGRLHRNNFSDTMSTVFSTPEGVNGTDVQIVSDTTVNTAGTEVIDNQNYTYHLSVFFDDTDTVGTDLRVYGCTVGYQ